VHRTIDPTVPLTSKKPSDESEEGDDEKKITSARPAGPPDGLLSSSELTQLFASSGPVFRSAYDEGIRQHRANGSERLPSFGDRVAIPSERKGAFEPEWTSYTHYWKTVLGMTCQSFPRGWLLKWLHNRLCFHFRFGRA